jgi:hypothetical protein
MTADLLHIVEKEAKLGDPSRSKRLRSLLGKSLSSAQIDQQWDTLTERLAARVAEIEGRVRGAWKTRWCSRNPSHRKAAIDELKQLKRDREEERRRYLFGMDCVLSLRSKHIETIEWALANAANTPAADRLLESDFCRSFSILLADGTEVVPFRMRDAARKVRAFKVSDSGNKSADALLVYDEEELRRYVAVLGYRVRCKTRDGTRSGLYTAQPPNRVMDTTEIQVSEGGLRR